MAYHPRIETPDLANLLTSRSRNSELWFIQNPKLEGAILGYTAKYRERYGVKLYGFAIEGSHLHGAAQFPGANRSDFMRDLNSSVARSVARLTPEYPGGGLFYRRYSGEFVPTPADIERVVLYIALQPVQDGLVERLSDYPDYNFFHDAIYGIERKYEVVHWKEFHAARKRNPAAPIKDYIEIVTLKYDRIPGYEHMSTKDYAKMMLEKLEKRRLEVVAERRAQGLGFLGPKRLKQIRRGSRPPHPKTSTRDSHRPRVLCADPELRAHYLSWYFDTYFAYKQASLRYRNGDLSTPFPPGTYRPYLRYQPPPE